MILKEDAAKYSIRKEYIKMQKDMHYYCIYYLCLVAGVKPEDAYIIAYNSQYTDESIIDDSILKLKDFLGDIIQSPEAEGDYKFHLTQTYIPAPHYKSYKSLSFQSVEEILIPFHFLPGFSGDNEIDWFTTLGGTGKLFDALYERAIKSIESLNNNKIDYNRAKKQELHRIGIILHVLADTYSHENFSAFWSWTNKINRTNYISPENSAWIGLLKKIWHHIFFCFYYNFFDSLPAVGHIRAYDYPDSPYLLWRYQAHTGEIKNISNPSRFYKAMFFLYEKIISQIPSINSQHSLLDDKTLSKKLYQGINTKGDLEARCKYWRDQIRSLAYEHDIEIPDEHLFFNKERMLNEIGELYSSGWWSHYEGIVLKKNITLKKFENSDFYFFHKEALEHRKFILSYLFDLQIEAKLECECTFELTMPEDEKQEVYLIGNSQLLGKWDICNAVGPMKFLEPKKYFLKIALPKGCTIKYKYIQNKTRWEGGIDRQIVCQQNLLIQDIWRN